MPGYIVCVLRLPTDDCRPDDETCFLLGHIRERPGCLQAIARSVTDSSLIRKYIDRVGDNEVLVEFTKTDIGETHRAVGTLPDDPSRVLVVARAVSSAPLIAAYAHKIGPGEALVEFDQNDIKEAMPA